MPKKEFKVTPWEVSGEVDQKKRVYKLKSPDRAIKEMEGDG